MSEKNTKIDQDLLPSYTSFKSLMNHVQYASTPSKSSLDATMPKIATITQPYTKKDEDYLVEDDYEEPVIQGATVQDKAVEYALRQEGKPYRYGGTSESGFDCSGLIYTAYKQQGVNVPRTTEAWLHSGRPRVENTKGKAGDVVILESSQSPSGKHAKLITRNLGNGRYEVVEAKSKKDGVVRSYLDLDKNKTAVIFKAQKGLKLIKKYDFR